ncbi:EAL domain-containing protein [Rossellomorea aquimaris]|uniref:putative bifunctional diguanylate cyclase/phosphodiesterase n=1 Tax=Rossellomorea aquimaris TaxID=189382 RepID=UPI001CD7A9DD|nr:GGDEF domain-containing phosphodiesterase [Rossellomorea aquimaris]MCA1053998.1 EAL domain-containing protein [Rossellomorea aquimaris]
MSKKDRFTYKKLAAAFERSEKRFHELVEFLPDPAVICTEGRITVCNTESAPYFGVKEKFCLIGEPILPLMEPEGATCFHDCFTPKPVGTVNPPVLITCNSAECEMKAVEVHSMHIMYNDQPSILLVFQDKSEISKLKEEIHTLTYYDCLTGLYSRRWFEENISVLISNDDPKPFAIMYLDLDRFKWINDTSGHEVGDHMLQQVAERLQQVVGKGDILMRLGGDDFAVIVFSSTTVETLSTIAERMILEVQAPYSIKGSEVQIACSIGITVYPDDSVEKDHLMRNAELALHKAKKAGRNDYAFFTCEMQAEFIRRANIEQELNRAIANNEFVLYYQPLINTSTQQVVGVEALIRWDHPNDGIISPGEFVSIAEETGQIIMLEKWVVYEACRQMKEWHSKGITPIKICINLSPSHFQQLNFIEDLKRIVDEIQLDPRYIDLEITENLAMQDTENVLQKLNSVKDMSITVSIDDFGTGFSSLLYLKKFPVQTLKIAQEFVRNLETDHENQTIVFSILALAKALQLNVVAEGVETEEQLTILIDQHCPFVQGYYYSPPLPADECFDFLQKGKTSDS